MDFRRQQEDYEDDLFYDELRRQVLQLTAEEDDEAHIMLEARKQGPHHALLQPICYQGWPGVKEDCGPAPAWMLDLWRSANGTGVFIPQGVQSRRRNRSRRKSEKGRTKRQSVKMN